MENEGLEAAGAGTGLRSGPTFSGGGDPYISLEADPTRPGPAQGSAPRVMSRQGPQTSLCFDLKPRRKNHTNHIALIHTALLCFPMKTADCTKWLLMDACGGGGEREIGRKNKLCFPQRKKPPLTIVPLKLGPARASHLIRLVSGSKVKRLNGRH